MILYNGNQYVRIRRNFKRVDLRKESLVVWIIHYGGAEAKLLAAEGHRNLGAKSLSAGGRVSGRKSPSAGSY